MSILDSDSTTLAIIIEDPGVHNIYAQATTAGDRRAAEELGRYFLGTRSDESGLDTPPTGSGGGPADARSGSHPAT